MEKREFLDFTKDELVPGTLTGKFFHDEIEKVVEVRRFAILLIEHDEKHPAEKKLAVYSKNYNNPYFSRRISTTCLDDEEMKFWLEAYNKETA